MRFTNNLDVNYNEIQNAKFQILATDPVTLVEAIFWYNSTSKRLKYYDGTTVTVIAIMTDLTAILDYKGAINPTANPNYPAGSTGDVYFFTGGSGKIGGASGESVQSGDMLVCNADNAGGTEASVGTSWDVVQKNLPETTPNKYNQTGVSLGTVAGTVTITHNLGTRAVVVQIFDEADFAQVYPDVVHATTNTITVTANGSAFNATITVMG